MQAVLAKSLPGIILYDVDAILSTCRSCGAVNRVMKDKLRAGPKCGKCGSPLRIPDRPVDVTGLTFRDEVISWPGIVLVEFWSPT